MEKLRACRSRIAVAFLALTLATAPVAAESFHLSVDVPTDRDGVSLLPSEIFRNDGNLYESTLELPGGTPVSAMQRLEDGGWLLTVGAPASLGGKEFEPRDVIRTDGNLYSLFLDGSAAGIPAEVAVDALFLDGGDGGDLILSLDAPALLDGAWYEPADLARWSGSVFLPHLDASALPTPIPPGTNVIGAARRGGVTVLAFDVPVTFPAGTFLPGELVAWDGTSFVPFASDPTWPPGSALDALSFPPPPGGIGASLGLQRADDGDLILSWTASCSAGAEDMAIYEGQMGNWYSHRRIDCSDDGAPGTETITPSPTDTYYLAVPHNANDEGSYGVDSLGVERPPAFLACRPTQTLGTCS